MITRLRDRTELIHHSIVLVGQTKPDESALQTISLFDNVWVHVGAATDFDVLDEVFTTLNAGFQMTGAFR